jgi:hypothetical protein
LTWRRVLSGSLGPKTPASFRKIVFRALIVPDLEFPQAVLIYYTRGRAGISTTPIDSVLWLRLSARCTGSGRTPISSQGHAPQPIS